MDWINLTDLKVRRMILTKEKIRKYIIDLGVDDVGFAKVEDYNSPKSYAIETFLPGAKTIISLVSKKWTLVKVLASPLP